MTARRPRTGFTMIELLTVIAIIAILAAIIFPVASTVQENARRGRTMSNMREIHMAVKQYQLDNRNFPDYLFGPAVDANGNTPPNGPALSMQQVASVLNSSETDPVTRAIKRLYSTGLFPEYVRSLETYSCPNNTLVRSPNDARFVTVIRPEYIPNGDPPVQEVPRAFYVYDAYDSSPAITGADTINLDGFYARYAKVWTPIDPNNTTPEYKRQLMWRSPPEDTYLTMTTWHVPRGKAIVLWLNGTAKVMDVSKIRGIRKGDLTVENGTFEQSAPFNMYLVQPSD